MGNQLQIFNNTEFGDVRVVMKDGAPWFVAADVARVLEIQNVRQNLANFDNDEKGVCNIDTPGGEQSMLVVNEPGLYRLIFVSRKPEAHKFQRWIYHDVLPTLRKTGSYSIAQKALPPVGYALDDVKVTAEKIQVMFSVKSGIAVSRAIDIVGKAHGVDLNSLKQLLPHAEHETGYLNTSQVGQKIGINPRATNKLLAECGWEYKDGRNWRLTDVGKAYGEEMPYTRNGHSGYQIRWNEEIVDALRERIC